MNIPRWLRIVLLTIFIAATLYGIYSFATFITDNEQVRLLVQGYGVFGVLVVSFIAGLNLLVPVPAAAFVPIFTSSGLDLLTIIVFLVLGTMLADMLAYSLGRIGKNTAANSYPELQAKITTTYQEHRRWLPFLVFGFAGFVPLPNEVWLIPLGLLGIKLRVFIVPLILGTIIYQTLAAGGVQTIFNLLP